MADDLSPNDARGLNTSILVRFLAFFLVAGFLFLLFFWVIFIRAVQAEVVLVNSVDVYEDGVLVSEELQLGSYDVESDYYEVYFDGIDLMRFVEGSSFEVLDVSEEDGFYTVSLNLDEGGIWISNMGGVLDLMVKTEDFMFQNVDGYFYIEKNNGEIFAYAYKHPLRVHFLDDSGNSLNSYLLPEGYYGDFEEGDVSALVADLRYAKLTKEYPFYALSEEQELDFWESFVAIDDSRYIGLLSGFKSVVRTNYDSSYEEEGFFDVFSGVVEFLREYLTFAESKKLEWQEQDTMNGLNQALYLSVKGEEEESVERLLELEEGSVVGDEYRAYLNYLNVVLNVSLYGGDLYAVKEYLRELLWGGDDAGEIVILRERLNEMYDLVNDGEVARAKEAFEDYERGWFSFLAMSVSELSEYRKDISEERELLSVLLLKENSFYDAEYFDLLESFEQAVIKVAISGADLDEERQAFVSSKIQVLNNIEELLAISGISVEEATDVMLFLLDSAEILMDEIESEAAILSYFEEELEESMLVLQFVNSSEYTSLTGTFDEKFEAYIKNQEDVADLQEYLQGLHLGVADEGELTLDEAKEIVYGMLDDAGVSYDAVVALGDSGYRLFEIEGAEIADTAFEARYDREGELIYDLEVDGIRFATGVNLDDLEEVVLGLTEEESLESQVPSLESQVDEESEVELTYAEELAVTMLIEYLDGYGIEIEQDDLVSWDLSENLFYVSGVVFGEVEAEFFVHASDDLITDLVLDGEDVDGIFYVGEFVEAVDSLESQV